MGRTVTRTVVVVGLLLATGALADEVDPARNNGRFYLQLQTGHAQQTDEEMTPSVEMDTADGFNLILGGGGGYNISDHWGVEIQAHGTELDVRHSTLGKIKELSNITLLPAAKFRWPIEGTRWVPYATAGVGYSMSDVNDTGNTKVKLDMDESSIMGAVGAGVDYFVSQNVAVGGAIQGWIYPDADTSLVVRSPRNQIIQTESGETSLNAVAFMLHVSLYPGQAAEPAGEGKPAKERRLIFADEGPFDTDDVRPFLELFGGHEFLMDDDFGGGIKVKAPGDFNATLGGTLGVNLSRHWGAEVQLMNMEPNLNRYYGGKVAELSNFTVLPGVRFRWPLHGDRVVPYARAGIGFAQNSIGDERQAFVNAPGGGGGQTGLRRLPKLDIDEFSVAGTVGVGIEYYLNHHVVVGLSLPYYIYPDLDTTITERNVPGQTLSVTRSSYNLSGPALLLVFKVLI